MTLAPTDGNTMTAHRARSVKPDLPTTEPVILTDGDGLAAINRPAQQASHRTAGKLRTLLAAHPAGCFGSLQFEDGGSISSFEEMPLFESSLIHGGFIGC